MLIKTLIIEDETQSAKKLAQQLEEIDASIEVVQILESVSDSTTYLANNQSFDLIFMNTHLKDGSCFEIFRKVAVKAPVVFTTTYEQYMVDAFQHHQIDYILKPIKKDMVEKSLVKYNQWKNRPDWSNYVTLLEWNSALKKVYKERFLVHAGKKILPILVTDIAYFYADSKLVMVTLKNGRHYIINHTLSELEHLLNPAHFYRINRKAIVNINAIQSMQMSRNYKWMLHLTPTPDFNIPIPTDKLTNFKAWINQ